jgi:hypothetical protein
MAQHLFIINLYADPLEFAQGINEDDQVLIVSTHSLFDSEKKNWRQHLSCPVDFLRFDHWNAQLEEAELDRKAFQRVRRWNAFTSIYQALYFKEVNRLKNGFIHKQLLDQGLIDTSTEITVGAQSYELHNLGISRTYWKSKGVRVLNQGPNKAFFLFRKRVSSWRPLQLFVALAKAFYLAVKTREVQHVQDGSKAFYLLSNRRIQLKEDLQTSSRRIRAFNPFSWSQRKIQLAAPVHSNEELLAMYPFVRRKNMTVIQDAFRPTSYPPYYYANSYNGCMLVAQDKVDYQFFKDAGLSVYPLGTLLKKKKLKASEEGSKSPVKTICLSLNHAGNWSTLISRCDTDGPIQALIQLATQHLDLNFIIRLHPNSSRPKAEGIGWHERIEKEIAALGMENLELSKVPIEEDWKRADLFISEYSLSVVDALQFGKMVIFLNLTIRRSFVTDLVRIGFKEANSLEELEREIQYCLDQPAEAYGNLTQSIANYNRTYLDF